MKPVFFSLVYFFFLSKLSNTCLSLFLSSCTGINSSLRTCAQTFTSLTLSRSPFSTPQRSSPRLRLYPPYLQNLLLDSSIALLFNFLKILTFSFTCIAVLAGLPIFLFFFGFEQEKRSTMGHYFGNCGKKQWPWQPKFYVTQSILFKSIAKNKVLNKTNENKKKKERKGLRFLYQLSYLRISCLLVS